MHKISLFDFYLRYVSRIFSSLHLTFYLKCNEYTIRTFFKYLFNEYEYSVNKFPRRYVNKKGNMQLFVT